MARVRKFNMDDANAYMVDSVHRGHTVIQQPVAGVGESGLLLSLGVVGPDPLASSRSSRIMWFTVSTYHCILLMKSCCSGK